MTAGPVLVRELAPAKLNLVLQVGPPRDDGLHPLCSLFAAIDLADEVVVAPTGFGGDTIECPGVEGQNLATAALEAFRRSAGAGLPPLAVRIAKRVPVAAGLGGGSADAAAVLRAANRITGDPLATDDLRILAGELGSDVPSQVEPCHQLVQGVGEVLEPIELPPLTAVLVPASEGLSTAAVYAELDRSGGWREPLDPEAVRRLAASTPDELATALDNDLEPAALSLRPDLEDTLERLRAAGAPAAAISGSGPTCFALFPDRAAAEAAAAQIEGALVSPLAA
ncbi:MAG TPA: 4-(cytidine 5'-diphospho)-2-C-methyl-D-erythritol kinase [Thermoleophilaceae bacterium]|jgi:4-diphosphocytidyl-2-C-methyl-D-erythritol kinase